MRATVIGGGIAGLTAAYRLLRAGHEVTCIDPGAEPGGLLRSEQVGGFLCEQGPQSLLDSAPDTQALIDDLDLRAEVVPADPAAARRFIFMRGRLRPVPMHPLRLLLSSALTWRARLALLREPRVPARRHPTGTPDTADETILEFATRRLGRDLARDLVAPAVIGVYAGDAGRLSVRACLPRLVELERDHGSLLRGLRARRADGLRPGRMFSFREGLQTLPRALAAALGTRLVRARARAIADAAGKWTVELEPAPGGPPPRPVPPADHLVLATGAEATATLLDPVAPAAAANLRQVRHAPVAVLCLGFEQAPRGVDLAAYGFLVRRAEGVRLLGCQYESSVFPGRAPSGKVLLRAIAGGSLDPEAVALPDAELLDLVLADLRRTCGLTDRPDLVRIYRHRPGVPQYEPGHLALAQAIEHDCRLHPGLHVLGWTLRGIGVNDNIAAASALARSLAPGA